MARQYVDFISAYCDNWCERCAFTDRCSHFAVTSALAMCDGDFEAALELAIGRPQQPGQQPQKTLRDRMADVATDYEEPSRQELDAIGREHDARTTRVGRHALAKASYDYMVAGKRWLDAHADVDGSSAALAAAVETLQRDLFFIHVKIRRALDGQDQDPSGAVWKSVVQNDWNGSAKVALISIERSERAWREIAIVFADEAATVLADILVALGQALREQFPRVMEFRRPGFDD
jgi:hypothetical protein